MCVFATQHRPSIPPLSPCHPQFETRAHRLTRRTSFVDLEPVHLSSLSPRIRLHLAMANCVDTHAKTVSLSNGTQIRFGWLLIASGAVPRQLPLPSNPHVITIRDQHSVMNLAAALKHVTAERLRVVLVGGGGIAMEVALHPLLRNCDVTWVSFPPPAPHPCHAFCNIRQPCAAFCVLLKSCGLRL
jgi:NADH dehydrogenase FAD-containing subunit